MVEGTVSSDTIAYDPRYYTEDERISICKKARTFLNEYYASDTAENPTCPVCMTTLGESWIPWMYCECLSKVCAACFEKMKRENVCRRCDINLETALQDIEKNLFRSAAQEILHLSCTCADVFNTERCRSCCGKFIFSQELKELQESQELQEVKEE